MKSFILGGNMVKAEKVIIKKKHIIETLKKMLETRVYSQISIEDVAQEAGLSKGGLRHYFAAKEDLYTELIEFFFNQIQQDNIRVIQEMELDGKDRAFISTLFGLEMFLQEKKNIRVLINIIQYGLEDEKIMQIIRKFMHGHLNLYETLIRDFRKETVSQKDQDTRLLARITQTILLFTGIFEVIDPINLKTSSLLENIMNLYKIDSSS